MCRRLMAREKQQHAGRDELVLRKPVAVLLQAHELAQEIGARRPPALGDERAKEPRHLARCRFGALVLVRRIARAADEERHLVGEMLETRELRARHAEHVHDHERGQRAGKFGDEIEFGPPADAFEQPGGQRLDVRTQRGNRACVEHAAREPPQPGVLGRIAKHHPQRKGAHQLLHARRFAGSERCKERPQAVGRHLPVKAHALDVLVAGEHPGFELRAPVRGVLVAQTLIERKRVGEELRIARPVVDRHDRSIAGKLRPPCASAPS